MGIPGAASRERIKTNEIKPVIKAAKLQAIKIKKNKWAGLNNWVITAKSAWPLNKMQLQNKLNKIYNSAFCILDVAQENIIYTFKSILFDMSVLRY